MQREVHISSTGVRGGWVAEQCISHSVMGASDIITPLTRVDFVYNGSKGMDMARNPRYSG